MAGDTTGVKPTSRGDWMGEKWDVRRGFIKMHIMVVDARTKKIYAISVTDDRTGDAPQLKKLLDEALQNIDRSPNVKASEKLSVGADGAYDTNENFEQQCQKKNVTPVIPVRKNFSVKTGGGTARKEQGLAQLGNCGGSCSTSRKNIRMFGQLTEEQKRQNQRQWKKDAGYGRRWSAEIAISTFKRVLGESVSARVWCNVVREIKFKAMVYNMMIDSAMEQEINED